MSICDLRRPLPETGRQSAYSGRTRSLPLEACVSPSGGRSKRFTRRYGRGVARQNWPQNCFNLLTTGNKAALTVHRLDPPAPWELAYSELGRPI